MNRRTALGAIAASPVFVAATPASATYSVPDSLDTQCRRFGLAQDCYLALIQAGRLNDAERAFELADAFFAVASSQCPALVR